MSTSSVVSTETPFTPRRRSLRIWLLSMAGAVVLAAGWIGYVAMLNSRVRAEQLGAYQAAQSRDQMRIPAYLNGTGQTFATQRLAQNNNPNSQQGNTYSSNVPVVQQNNLQYQQSQLMGNYSNPTPPVDRAEAAATQSINELSNQLSNATGEQKKALRKSLTEAVGKLFDLRHAAQAKQVEKLESELAEAKELLKKRSERKDEIVDRRIAELLQSADDLAWNRGIANPPVPATNYALPPNGYPQALLPNGTYNTVPSGSYPYSVVPNPYNTAPTYSPGTPPGTLYSNPVPPSSTRPQLIPMLSPDSGQSSLLETAPRINTNTYSAPSAPSATTSPSIASSQLLPLLNASPEDVVRQFITSLQNNDTITATNLLTSQAQSQMAEAKFQLQPFGKTTSFQVGVAKYTSDEKDVALVDATVTEPSQSQAYEAVFECHLDNGSWRISGLAIQASDQTVRFDFEDADSITEHLKTSIVGRDPEIPLVIANALTIAGVLPSEPKAEMDTQPTDSQTSTTSSKSSIASLESSKAVIEAAYAYEEAILQAVEGGLLWKKGLTNSNEYSSLKRKAAKAKAIWAAIDRDLQNRQRILEQEVSTKQHAINEIKSDSKREEQLLELSKLHSELHSLAETRAWAVDFEKQSIESLEKKFEQSEEQKPETKPEAEQKSNE